MLIFLLGIIYLPAILLKRHLNQPLFSTYPKNYMKPFINYDVHLGG